MQKSWFFRIRHYHRIVWCCWKSWVFPTPVPTNDLMRILTIIRKNLLSVPNPNNPHQTLNNMSNVSFKGNEKLRKFLDFLRENGINKYVALPGKIFLSLRPPIVLF